MKKKDSKMGGTSSQAGYTLEEIAQMDECCRPHFVEKCIDFIEKEGIINPPDKIRKPPQFLFSVIRPPEWRRITWAKSDEFFTEGGLVNEYSNEGGFLFIMNLKI